MIDQPFFQLTLPLMVTILVATFVAVRSTNRRIEELSHRLDVINRRLDDVDRRFGDVDGRFGGIDRRFDEVMRVLMSIDHRLTVLEERGFPLVRG